MSGGVLTWVTEDQRSSLINEYISPLAWGTLQRHLIATCLLKTVREKLYDCHSVIRDRSSNSTRNLKKGVVAVLKS